MLIAGTSADARRIKIGGTSHACKAAGGTPRARSGRGTRSEQTAGGTPPEVFCVLWYL